jgi:hypothetical protein
MRKTSLLSINWDGKKFPGAVRRPGSGRSPGEPLRSYVALLDLAPIRDAIEPQLWPRQRQKIAAVAQQAARMLIEDNDAFAIHQDEVCIITFGQSTRAIATFNSAAIGHKIVQNLLGMEGVGRVAIEPVVFALTDLLRHEIADGATDRDDPCEPANDTSAATEPPDSDRRKQLLDLYRDSGPAEISIRYHPIWSAATGMVRFFLLVPTRENGPSLPDTGYQTLPANPTDSDLTAFDIGNIESGLLALKQSIDVDRETRLLLPLHFNTAGSNQGRAELMEIFPNLPAAVREHLSIALFGIPSGVPQGRLNQVFSTLKPMAQEVSAVLAPTGESGPALWNVAARIRSVGIPRIRIAMPEIQDNDILEKANSVCSRAVSLGLKVSAVGLRDGNQAHRLSVTGCTEFGGPLFGGPFPTLPAPYAVHSRVFEQGS